MKKYDYILVAGIICLSIVLHAVITSFTQYRIKETDFVQRKQIEDDRKSYIATCLESAYEMYSTSWSQACKSQNKEGDCVLDIYISGLLDERHLNAQNLCFKN